MPKIDLSQFDSIEPPKIPQYIVNATLSGNLSLNDKLKNEISCSEIGIRVNKDGSMILIEPNKKDGYKILKSGSIRAETVTRELTKRGVSIPASYKLEWDNEINMWIGTIISRKQPNLSVNKKPNIVKQNMNKPRTTGLKEMIS